MNPLTKAIEECKYRIPREILDRVFIDGSRFGRGNWRSTVDEQILALVVRPRVLVDCNMIGGTQQTISLEGLPFETSTEYQWATVVHVPKSRTFGKSINSVLEVRFFSIAAATSYVGGSMYGGSASGSMFNPNGSDNSAVTAAAIGVLAAQDKIPYTSTARISLIAENTVMIRDGIPLGMQGQLQCVLADDENLSNLQLRSYRFFSDLVEYAVKSYIYKELKIAIDVGELRYGQLLGAFKDVVDSYSDAEANYRDFRDNKWEKVAFQNDAISHQRFIGMLTGSNR